MLKLRCIYFDQSYYTIIPSGVHPRVEMTHVASLKVFFEGGSLESLCDVMQRPDGATIKELIALESAITQRKRGISVR